MNIQTIFNQLGGTSKMSALLNENKTTVSAMKRRNKLPIRHWDTVIEQCKLHRIRGVNYHFLVKLHKDQ
jgi:hypothetical protein